MDKCLGRIHSQAAADEAELPQLKEARLACSRDVISHAELLIKGYAEWGKVEHNITHKVFDSTIMNETSRVSCMRDGNQSIKF